MLIFLSVCFAVFLTDRTEAIATRIMPLYPIPNSVVDGRITFRATVEGLRSDQYTLSWSVNNDKPTLMQKDIYNPAISTAKVTVTNWGWDKSNTYNIRFIAKIVATGQTITSDPVPIHIASKVSSPNPDVMDLYTYPWTNLKRQASSWALTHPLDAERANFLASQPVAVWFGGWNTTLETDVRLYVSKAAEEGKMPVVVAYNIPNRDCGHESAGGVESVEAYEAWIYQMAQGIGDKKAIVVLEPDSLTTISCLSSEDQTFRLDAISRAVNTLKQNTNTQVYIDAGNARWKSVEAIAPLLTRANIAEANGFSLNVSNFVASNDNMVYGKKLSIATGDKHFVIDTSRNGNGTTDDNQWCNPSGRAIGLLPTLRTNDALIDGFLWIKVPGESDGQCGPALLNTYPPKAGVWWPEYALSLIKNAGL